MADILFSIEDHVAEITINRPDKSNALNAAVREGLFDAFKRANEDPECRVVILTAAGSRVFCAGADLVEMAALGITTPPPDYMPVLGKNVAMDKPVIAAVNGAAMAGGFLLVQMCDLVIAAQNASFAITEARRGRGSPWAIPLTKQLPRRVMTELLVTAEPMSAVRAHDLGFVNALAEPDALMERARAMAKVIARNAPLTVRANLRMIRFADDMGVQAAERVADEIFQEVYLSEDAREGPLAFKEKREPVWKGR
ncbi:enoyl-CoA hydratase/isomerase family protein [Sphingobium fuliginis]|uniref:Enoyl-CoA hydratase/isomerase family protein n=1 Tax=Sphingobium fuliginis ATCC 27551 TaxID=1208342 RepID=A0A5B8CGW1_SPHSA|nr:enoyl-CoA hydratase-related protein [Sphingobium fuliginis]QDC37267.1 enoyl-CoA hydratase/isomerase family protein [Sphingobium fuliginis ATCC 27551]